MSPWLSWVRVFFFPGWARSPFCYSTQNASDFNSHVFPLAGLRGVLVSLLSCPPSPEPFLQIRDDYVHQVDEWDPFVNRLLICMASELYFPISDFPKSAHGACFVGLCICHDFKNRCICFKLDKLQSAFCFSR